MVCRAVLHPDTEHGHNHELEQSRVQAMAKAGTRVGIPKDFEVFGQFMADGGAPASFILHSLETKARKEGIAIDFNYEDVRTKYSATATEKALDVQAMIQYLQARVRALALNSNLISLHLSSAHHHWPTPIYACTWGHLSAVVVRRGTSSGCPSPSATTCSAS